MPTPLAWMLTLQVAAQEFFCHPVPLGANLYDKDRPKVVPPSRSVEGGASSLQQKGSDACTTSPAAGPGTAAEQQDTAAGSNAERVSGVLFVLQVLITCCSMSLSSSSPPL